MKLKRMLRLLAFVTLALGGVQAMAAEEHPAQTIVIESTTGLIDVLKTDAERIKTDKVYLQEQVDHFIVPNVDFETMTKLAVGKFWRDAKDEEKVALIDQFKKLLLNTYTGALTQYGGETIEFQPFRAEDREDRAVVRSIFKPASGNDVPVLYKLRDKDGWLIYDIEVNNISLVTSYRTAFASEISKGGIEGLLATMKEKNAES